MHNLVCDITGRHYNAWNSDVSHPCPARGKGKRQLKFRLVFYNLPEVDKEDSFATVRDVLANKMEIDTNNEIEIEKAHKLGRKRDYGKP